MRSVILLAAVLLVLIQGTPTTRDLSHHFDGLNGTFVVLRGSTNEYIRHNPLRAAERFAPCSTFKIAHTAILLETGVVPDPALTLKYDPALKQPSNWARDFDLTGAFKASALWYYQIMAQRLGIERERQFLERFRYGNAVTTGGIDEIGDPFWVDGSLRISANEQVQYLQKFHEGKLGLSERATRMTKEIMITEETQSQRLSAKSGACQPVEQDTSNWYVGFVERGNEVYYFAVQIGAKDYGRAYSERIPISRAILKELGILD
jgi:beta-lactamase class D